jgi:ribonuclease HI
VFAWKLARNGLATQENRHHRRLTKSAVCTICGNGVELALHAVTQCTKAKALWHEMRTIWKLPDRNMLKYTGPDWLPVMLGRLSKEEKARTLLIMWRAWYMRNDMIFGAGRETVTGSAKFLENYDITLSSIKSSGMHESSDKGKRKMGDYLRNELGNENQISRILKEGQSWKPPEEGWVKLNTDAGFCPLSGKASTGIVVRGPSGEILLTTWRTIRSCASPEEAEAEACLQGAKLVAQWIKQPTFIEMDCQTLVKAIVAPELDRAAWAGLVEEIRTVMATLPEVKVKREGNKVAHLLAQHALRCWECVVRHFSMPDWICQQVNVEAVGAGRNSPDCNSSNDG